MPVVDPKSSPQLSPAFLRRTIDGGDPCRSSGSGDKNQEKLKDDWPIYYIGAFPYCFALPEYRGPSGARPKMGQIPGTHWYHAHKQGSTAINVANGMTGAFIIEEQYDADLNAAYRDFYRADQPYMKGRPDRWVQAVTAFQFDTDGNFQYEVLRITDGKIIFNGKHFGWGREGGDPKGSPLVFV